MGVGDALAEVEGDAVAGALVGLADRVGDCVAMAAGSTLLQEMRRNETSATAILIQ